MLNWRITRFNTYYLSRLDLNLPKTASATPLDFRGCTSEKIDKIRADWPIHFEAARRSKWTEICEILMLINANKLGLSPCLSWRIGEIHKNMKRQGYKDNRCP